MANIFNKEWNSVTELGDDPKFTIWNRVRKCTVYSKVNASLFDVKPFGLYKKFVPEYFDHVHVLASDKYLYLVSFPYGMSDDNTLLLFIANELGHEVTIHGYTDSWYSPTTTMMTIKLGKRLDKRKYINNIFVKVEDELCEPMDSIIGFLEESNDFKIDGVMTSEVYNQYVIYCVNKNLQPMSNIEFSKHINRSMNMQIVVKRVGSKVCKFFTSKEGGKSE